MYSGATGIGYLSHNISTEAKDPIWYMIADHSPYYGYDWRKYCIKIHGLNHDSLVKNRLCVDNFASNFGINEYHIKQMKKVIK